MVHGDLDRDGEGAVLREDGFFKLFFFEYDHGVSITSPGVAGVPLAMTKK